jgi:hypothetical protein
MTAIWEAWFLSHPKSLVNEVLEDLVQQSFQKTLGQLKKLTKKNGGLAFPTTVGLL